MKNLLLIIPLLMLSAFAFSQQKVKGSVYDSNTKEPLAFVNIVYNDRQQGTTTDMDGHFSIDSKEPVQYLIVSYIGYQKDTILKNEFSGKTDLKIFMSPVATTLGEVTVLPGENPAHRIIQLVIDNRDLNNPEKMQSFAYTSYNKLYATVDLTSIPVIDTLSNYTDSIVFTPGAADTIPDSTINSLNRAKQITDSMYFFMMESVSERKFRSPDKNSEVVIANKMSGLKNPLFFMLATQMQSFSFYSDLITVYDKTYLSPVSKGSTEKYLFIIEDTLFSEEYDTIFVISFRPRKNKNFEGLKGILHINSRRYALQNVMAEPDAQDPMLSVSIQQKYEFVDGTQWFPVQLNTNFTFNSLQLMVDNYSVPLLGIGKSYISNIQINPVFNKNTFDHVVIESDKNANKKTDDFWNEHRPDSLSQREQLTYQFIDSVGEAEKFDKKIAILEYVASGCIPVGFVSIDLNRIMWYNNYEGYRLGFGLKTNDRILHWFSTGGYAAYGFKDKAVKYGGQLEFYPYKPAEILLGLYYSNDVEISDYYRFRWSNGFLSTESYRDLLITEIDPVEKYLFSAEARVFRYIKANLYCSYNNKHVVDFNRYFLADNPFQTGITENSLPFGFSYYEAGIAIKFAYKEKFLQTPKNNKISLGTDYPILWLNYSAGIPSFDNAQIYHKFQARLSKKFKTTVYGNSYATLVAGWASETTPYTLLYKGPGTQGWLDVSTTFNTMGVNEFISDRFAHLFLKHDFGSLLFRTKIWKPELCVLTNIGWSDYSDKTPIVTSLPGYNKLYYESGIQINYILRAFFIGYGFSVYYRYGPYHLPETIDNFAFKLTLTYSFE
ncbi:MAG TPA: DUF5686 family protein [Bacteroidales bacterium]|nr:DUF5686 family protein [Bacteroidales bacterium]